MEERTRESINEDQLHKFDDNMQLLDCRENGEVTNLDLLNRLNIVQLRWLVGHGLLVVGDAIAPRDHVKGVRRPEKWWVATGCGRGKLGWLPATQLFGDSMELPDWSKSSLEFAIAFCDCHGS